MSSDKNKIGQNRTPEFQRNQNLEAYLQKINTKIRNIEGPVIKESGWPLIFIIGVPRCGSTLLLQILANNGFAYPSNIIARFYENPYIGALIQKVLAEEDKKEQIGINKEIDYESTLGKTQGGLNVSEFWYYWRRFFNFGEIQKLGEEELRKINKKEFRQGLFQLSKFFQQPLALKGMILNWHLDYLAEIIENSIFVFIERDLRYVAQSLYLSRKRFFGNYQEWYSFKPPEYKWLKNLPPLKQVAGQAYYTDQVIKEGKNKIDSERTITISYQNICKKPKRIVQKISGKVKNGRDLFVYNGPEEFTPSQDLKIGKSKFENIEKYIEELKYE